MTRCDIKINCKSSLSPFFSVSVLYTIIFPTSLKIYFLISFHECYHAFFQISERTMWAFRNDFERTQTRGDVTYSIYSTLLFSSLLFSFLFPLFFSLPSLLFSSIFLFSPRLFSSFLSDCFREETKWDDIVTFICPYRWVL